MNDTIFINNNSQNLIISFTGYRPDGNFEWKNLLQTRKDVDILFVRDINQKWYLTGIKSVSTDVESTIQYFNTFCDKYEKICLLGSSMGGFASILYGYLLSNNHDVIIKSFGPQVDIESPEGNPWTISVINTFITDIPEKDRIYSRLHKVIDIHLDCTIYYGIDHPYDGTHYDKISKYTKSETFSTDKHAIALYMKQNDIMNDVLDNLF